jgi:hypothetical protein
MFFTTLRWAVPAVALTLLGLAQLGAADGPVLCDACPPACCKKGCEPRVETKKHAKRVYDDTCEEFCLPKCSLAAFCNGLFSGWKCNHHDCHHHSAGCADCESCTRCEHRPRTRKYLLVKIRHHEECHTKCVPVLKCCPDELPCDGAIPGMAPGKAPEPIPAPMKDADKPQATAPGNGPELAPNAGDQE